MKIDAKKYAEALFETVDKMNQDKAGKAIELFIDILVQNNNLSQIDKIIYHFCRIWDKEKGLINAEITSSRPLNSQTSKLLKDYLLKKTKKQIIESKELVEADIFGGVIIKYEDKILDGSLKKRLYDLKNAIIK